MSKTELELLLVTKFIYGTRIFTIISFSTRGIPLFKFTYLNSLVIAVWLSCILGIGWLIGHGSSLFLDIYKNPVQTSIGLILLMVIFNILRHFISKYLLSKKS